MARAMTHDPVTNFIDVGLVCIAFVSTHFIQDFSIQNISYGLISIYTAMNTYFLWQKNKKNKKQ